MSNEQPNFFLDGLKQKLADTEATAGKRVIGIACGVFLISIGTVSCSPRPGLSSNGKIDCSHAVKLSEQGKTKEALVEFKKMLFDCPKTGPARAGLLIEYGKCLDKDGQGPEAGVAYAESAGIKPSIVAYYLKAVGEMKEKQTRMAVLDLEEIAILKATDKEGLKEVGKENVLNSYEYLINEYELAGSMKPEEAKEKIDKFKKAMAD